MNVVSKANNFYMSWCLECHRSPEKYLRPQEAIYTMGYTTGEDPAVQAALGTRLVEEYSIRSEFLLTNCSTCHR